MQTNLMGNKTVATQLKDLIIKHFSLGELQELCFEIGFDHEELPNTRGEKSINVIVLLKTLDQNDLLSQFINLCKEKRPFIEWPDSPTELDFEEDLQTAAQLQAALDKYKKHIQDEWGKDPLLDGPLDEHYIRLQGQGPKEILKQDHPISETGNEEQSKSSSLEQFEASKQNPQNQVKEPQFILQEPPPLKLQEAVEKHQRLIVLGAAGTGKSTFLHYLAHQKAQDESDTIPILVPLSKFADELNKYDKAKDKNDELARESAVAVAYHIQAGRDAIKKQIDAGHKVFWLLDGFDEAIKITKDREGLVKLIDGFVADQQCVITTRPESVKHLHNFSNATQYKICELSQDDAKKFLRKWFVNQDKKASDVLKWLDADPHRWQLTTKPLHLVLLTIAKAKETSQDDLPETRVQLYKEFIDDYLNKRIEKKKDGNGVFPLGNLKRDDARTAAMKGFYYLGWVLFHQERELSNNGTTPEKQVIDCLEQAGYSNEDAEAILTFWQEAGVQKSFHQTFWPYAAACKLYDDWQTNPESTWQFLSSATRKLPYASRLHHPDWQEPILMLAALMDKEQLNNLIDRLLQKQDKEERYLHQNLRLAAAILGEIETAKIDEEYERRIIKKLGELTRNYPKAHQVVRNMGLWSVVGILVFELLLLSQWRLLMQFGWFSIIQLGIITILVVRQLGELFIYLGQSAARGKKRSLWDVLWRFLNPTKTIQYLSKHVENIGMRGLRVLRLDSPNPGAFIEALSSGGVLAIPELEHTFSYWALREKPQIRRPWQRDGYFDWQLNTNPPYEVVKGLEKIGGKKVVPFLSQIMNDWTGRISLAATDALGKIGNEAAIEALIHAIKNNLDEDVQRSATIALGKSGDKKAIPSLIDTLKNPTLNFDREPAAQALIQIGNSTLPALCDTLRDENTNSDTRQEISKIMGKIGDPQVIPVLIEWLENRQGYPRDMRDELAQIEKALGQLGKNNEKYANQYLDIYKTRQDWDVRRATMRALGKTGVTSVVPDLINLLLIEPRDWVIAEALANIGDTRAIVPIISLLTNMEYKDPWFPNNLIEALGQINDEKIVRFLIETLENGREETRQNAAKALGNIGDPVAVEPLILALEDESISVQTTAARALGEIKSPKALEPLIKAIELIDFPNYEWERAYRSFIPALAALVQHGDIAAVPVLAQVLERQLCYNSHYHADIVRATVQALGKIRDLTAIDVLIESGFHISLGDNEVIEELRNNREIAIPRLITHLSTSNNYWIRIGIVKALGEIGDEKAIPTLVKILANDDTSINGRATQALGKIGGIEEITTLLIVLKDERKTHLHREVVTALGRLAESIISKDDPQKGQDSLESARKALWQRRFAHYKEDVFTAYEKVVTSLTIVQVRELPQNDKHPSSASATKTSIFSYIRDQKWLLLFLTAVLLVAIETLSGFFADILGSYLPSGIAGGIFLAVLVLIIILLIGIDRYFDNSR